MNKWEAKPEDREGSWITIEHDTYITVCPTTDVRPHDLYSMTCECTTNIESGDQDGAYNKPMVIHNRHEDNDRLAASFKALGI